MSRALQIAVRDLEERVKKLEQQLAEERKPSASIEDKPKRPYTKRTPNDKSPDQ